MGTDRCVIKIYIVHLSDTNKCKYYGGSVSFCLLHA